MQVPFAPQLVQILPFLKAPVRRTRTARPRRAAGTGDGDSRADSFDASGAAAESAPAAPPVAVELDARSPVTGAAEVQTIYYGEYWSSEEGMREAKNAAARVRGQRRRLDDARIQTIVKRQLESGALAVKELALYAVMLEPGVTVEVNGAISGPYQSSYLDDQEREIRYAAVPYGRPSEPICAEESASIAQGPSTTGWNESEVAETEPERRPLWG